ncbi:MAG: hypothetical protein ACR2HM_00510 [Acidimicrobiales bacterium]
MSVPARLAAFAVALVATFGIGFGVGAAVDSSSTPAAPTHGEHAP